MRRPKVVSREGIEHRPEFVAGMLPASVRYLDGLRKLPRSKPKPLCEAEQRILDACLFVETLTGKPRNSAAIVAALANLRHADNASDWMTILKKRGLVEFEDLNIKLRSAGRYKANPPTATPKIAELHSLVVAHQWGPYQRGLKAFIERYPQSYTRAELAAAADIELESFSLDHTIKSLLRQRLVKLTADCRLIASAALFPAKAIEVSTPLPGMPVKALAPLFGLTPRAVRSAIGAGVFPVATYIDRDRRRYADPQVVKAYFAAKHAEGAAAVADAATPATETAPDWRLVYKVEGQSQEENNAMLQGAADEMKAKGATHGRATIIPEAGTLFVEGWRFRPAREPPLPTARDCAASMTQ
jgi:hypothetical protein